MPFIIGVRDINNNAGLPSKLPFRLEQDNRTGLISQKYSKTIDNYLKRAYQQGSLLSTPLGQGSFGKRRADEAIKTIIMALNKPLRQMGILEVGCGDGYLLSRLQDLGAKEVIGCEPSNSVGENEKRGKVKIIKDFFSPKLFDKPFDLVLSYGVLEHLHQPLEVVRSLMTCIKNGGILFAGVPNCEHKMKLGDPGILAHEHWNYFTPLSFKQILLAAGLERVKVVVGQNRAVIYGWGVKPFRVNKQKNYFLTDKKDPYLLFCSKVKSRIHKLQGRIDKLSKLGEKIGLYGGGTQLTALLDFKIEPRFFDGDEAKWGKYYPAFSSAIEPPKNLIVNPVKELWIAAVDYDQEIQDDLERLRLKKKVRIFSLKRFLEQKSSLV